MRDTGLKRKSSLQTPIWSVGYLSSRALLRELRPACTQLHGRALDLGCGNSPYQPLLTSITSYVPYDVDRSSLGAHVIGTAESLPFASASFDSALCTQVLEHVAQPAQVIAEIARVLKPAGRLVLSAPQAWRLHEQPYDYFRYTRFGLQTLLSAVSLSMVSCEPTGGAWTLAGQIINNHIWRNPPVNRAAWLVSRAWCSAASVVVNASSSALDAAFHDPDDTLNYVILAEKPR